MIKKLILILLIFITNDVMACRCPVGEYETTEYGFNTSGWVFVGTYQKEEFDKENNIRKGYFNITNKLKGDFNKFSFITRPVEEGCLTDISVGIEYVVFVPKNGHIKSCNLTRRFVPESQNEYYVYSPKTVKKLEKLARK